jgi:hypothetical protein
MLSLVGLTEYYAVNGWSGRDAVLLHCTPDLQILQQKGAKKAS